MRKVHNLLFCFFSRIVKKFYFDTSVWRDYYENRSDKFRPLGEWALKLINEILENQWIILFSDLVIEELKVKYSEEEINKILEVVSKRDLLVRVDISEQQIKEAAKLCKERNIAFGDALHAILARDNEAIMVSRDKHFWNF